MADILAEHRPFERFSPAPMGLAPGLLVNIRLPLSGRIIPGLRALIDTGAEMTWVYPRAIQIDVRSEVVYDPDHGIIAVELEISGHMYAVRCAYFNFSDGTEDMLLGMDMISQWLMKVDGRRQLCSITHLEPADSVA